MTEFVSLDIFKDKLYEVRFQWQTLIESRAVTHMTMYALSHDHREACAVAGRGHACLSDKRALDGVTGVAYMSCTMLRPHDRDFRRESFQGDRSDAWT